MTNNDTEELLKRLIDVAKDYSATTGRILPIHGEIGELAAEATCNVARHRPGASGSDGKIGNEFVEIKTITPKKKKSRVRAKRKGNFSKLIVVKIETDFSWQVRMIDRRNLKLGKGKFVTVSWNSLQPLETNDNRLIQRTSWQSPEHSK